MTSEAAVTKLYYLFNAYQDPKQIKKLIEKDLRGELSI